MFKRIKHAWMVLIGRAAIRQIFDKKSSLFDHESWKTSKSAEYIPRTPTAALPEKVYVDLVPMHVNFVAKSITNEEVSRQYIRSGKFNGRPISYMSLGPGVFRFKFYTKTGPVYTDCFSETFSGALLKLVALINQMDKIPAVFKQEPNNECGTDPS